MPKQPAAEFPPPPIPEELTLPNLRTAAQSCRACDLYAGATQAVVGAGPRRARLLLVGEQPGDHEDLEGHPFVGPAGRILDAALEAAGIARSDVFLTNAVKHFRFEERGKRRIHQRPDRWHVKACLPWLRAELAIVRPEAVVLLGATAARALLGPSVRVGASRGQALQSELAGLVTVTVHPSSIVRIREKPEREAANAAFVEDLHTVAEWLAA